MLMLRIKDLHPWHKADPDTPVRTIKAQGGQYTGPFHWDNRVFTLEELKRLQTFPDNYKIIGNCMDILSTYKKNDNEFTNYDKLLRL